MSNGPIELGMFDNERLGNKGIKSKSIRGIPMSQKRRKEGEEKKGEKEAEDSLVLLSILPRLTPNRDMCLEP